MDDKKADEAKLDRDDQEVVEDHKSLKAPVVYEIIRQKGLEELRRPVQSLWWSGVAAGIAISTSVFCEAFLHMHLPDAEWRPLVENLGYCVGFLIVILGGFQLFTEQTVTAILPLLADRTRRNLFRTARLWGIVFVANMVGTFLAALLAILGLADTEQLAASLEISRHFAEKEPLQALLQGVPAGFLIAALVWMLPSSEGSTFWVIIVLTYVIALGEFAHVVAGSTEVFLLMLAGELPVVAVFAGFILPTFVGNVIGGAGLFSLIAYGQVSEEI